MPSVAEKKEEERKKPTTSEQKQSNGWTGGNFPSQIKTAEQIEEKFLNVPAI